MRAHPLAGGVFFEQARPPECFGCMLRDESIAGWKTKVEQKQVIGQAEIFPVLVSKLTWAERLENKRVLFVPRG